MGIERILQEIECQNRGWLRAGNVPPLYVFLNGKRLKNVMAVHRRKGIVVVCDRPIKLDKWRKRVIERRAYGAVTVGPI